MEDKMNPGIVNKMIVSKETAERYTWGVNCVSWVLHQSDVLSVKLEEMPAGAAEELHFHQHADQFFFIQEGKAVFYIENERVELLQGQGITIPRLNKHIVKNESTDTVQFLVISQPSTTNDRINISQHIK